MRKFDWFISGAVALLYCEIANQNEREKGIAERFDPDRDTTWLVVYFLEGELFINWPFIFALIGTACFFTVLGKLLLEQRKK
jgi:hypothetical protein